MPGTSTFQAEVTHVSKHGFWLLLADEELFLPFTDFPWFRGATIEGQGSNFQPILSGSCLPVSAR